VVGDAAVAADMPKSAFAANSQAALVSGHILADLTGAARPESKTRNTCWSMLAPDDSVKIGADYRPGNLKGKHILVAEGSFVSKPGESTEVRKDNYEESVAWYQTLTDQMFAKSATASHLPAKRG
jgi:hypothetical protein